MEFFSKQRHLTFDFFTQSSFMIDNRQVLGKKHCKLIMQTCCQSAAFIIIKLVIAASMSKV